MARSGKEREYLLQSVWTTGRHRMEVTAPPPPPLEPPPPPPLRCESEDATLIISYFYAFPCFFFHLLVILHPFSPPDETRLSISRNPPNTSRRQWAEIAAKSGYRNQRADVVVYKRAIARTSTSVPALYACSHLRKHGEFAGMRFGFPERGYPAP
jgi:hypothetical protein